MNKVNPGEDGRTEIKLRDLLPFTEYVVRVFALNRKGKSEDFSRRFQTKEARKLCELGTGFGDKCCRIALSYISHPDIWQGIWSRLKYHECVINIISSLSSMPSKSAYAFGFQGSFRET